MSAELTINNAFCGPGFDIGQTFCNKERTYDDAAGSASESGWDIQFKPDGTKFYFYTRNNSLTNAQLYEYECSTPWDITTATLTGSVLDTGATKFAISNFYITPDGTKVYFTFGSISVSGIRYYTLSTPWDITTATFQSYTDTGPPLYYVTGIWFKDDGTRMYLGESNGVNDNNIYEYNLSTAWDPSSYSLSRSVDMDVLGHVNVRAMYWETATRFWVILLEGKIVEFSLSEAWNITTIMEVTSRTTDISSAAPGLWFSPNGDFLYWVQYNGAYKIHQICLTPP